MKTLHLHFEKQNPFLPTCIGTISTVVVIIFYNIYFYSKMYCKYLLYTKYKNYCCLRLHPREFQVFTIPVEPMNFCEIQSMWYVLILSISISNLNQVSNQHTNVCLFIIILPTTNHITIFFILIKFLLFTIF